MTNRFDYINETDDLAILANILIAKKGEMRVAEIHLKLLKQLEKAWTKVG
jgi:hypothetical protein